MNREVVIDTNVFLSDGAAIKKFGQTTINIPFVVLQELDKHKTDSGDVGLNTRLVIRFLEELRERGDLIKGVLTKEGSVVKVIPEIKQTKAKDMSADDMIIQTALDLAEKKDVTLVSNDICLRVKASVKGLIAKGFNGNQKHADESELFTGLATINIDSAQINSLYSNGSLELEECKGLFPNQFVLFRDSVSEKHTAIARVAKDGVVNRVQNTKDVFGIKSKNLEQACAIDILMDPTIKLVTLMGMAGTGKTLISLATALELVLSKKEFDKLIIMRPPIPMGKDIGYLPGTLEEKMSVWLGPIYDNLETVMKGDNSKITLDYLINSGKVEVMPPTFIRGRSLQNSILLVDEAQSLTVHEVKTIATRMHESSKLILTGDVRQIDNTRLSAVDNGLAHIVEVFKNIDIAGHITLTKGERGTLAALAAELL